MASTISIIIPVFNSAITLPELVQRVVRVCVEHAITCEILLVDDGSTDDSWSVIESLAGRYPFAGGLRFQCNMGQNAATIAGLQHARQPLAMTLDDDLQHMPEHMPSLLAALTPDADIIYAGPAMPPKGKIYGVLAVAVKNAIAAICCAPFLRHMQTYRLLRTNVYPWQGLPLTRQITVEGVLATVKPKARKIRVDYQPRAIGTSTYTPGKLLILSFNTIRYALLQKLPRGEQAVITQAAGWLRHDGPPC